MLPARVKPTFAIAAVLLGWTVACSSGREGEGREDRDRERIDDGDEALSADGGGATKTKAPAKNGGGANRWTGTFRGETEVPDGGLPDGGTAWRGEGTVTLEVASDEVTGRVEAQGTTLEASGNVNGNVLRAWLKAPAGGPRTEGVLLGDVQGERLTGTWRTSGPGGEEVRAGTFEAHR
jgi:hypothetical protein